MPYAELGRTIDFSEHDSTSRTANTVVQGRVTFDKFTTDPGTIKNDFILAFTDQGLYHLELDDVSTLGTRFLQFDFSVVFFKKAYKYGNQKSILFNGVDEYLDGSDNIEIEYPKQKFSTSFWVNFASLAADADLFGKYDAVGDGGWSVRFLEASDKIEFRLRSNNSEGELHVTTPALTLSTGTWYNFIITYDGLAAASGINIYFNGSAESLLTITDTLTLAAMTTTANSFAVGAKSGGAGDFFSGNLDEITILTDKELSASEVASFYNSGKPRKTMSNDNLDSYFDPMAIYFYRMGDDPEDDATKIVDQFSNADLIPVNMDDSNFVNNVP
jgi:hypothetical protein